VLDNSNQAIPGVTMRLFQLNQGPSGNLPQQVGTPVVTDARGQFTMRPAPVGVFKLMADGGTAQREGVYPWPTLEYDIVTVPGQNNTVGSPIYLPRLSSTNRLCVSDTTGGTLTIPQAPGFALTIAPGSATFPGGSRSGCVTVTPVNMDKVPMAPGFGQQPRFIVTIQPVGTTFNPPAAITLPNVDGLAPRAVTEMYSYDHDLASFVSIGTATVSADGSVIKSDPGVGVLKAGWHCGGDPNTTGTAATCPTCQKCSGDNCVNDDSAPFDDGKFCTSCDGQSPGPDCCRDGKGVAKQIEDREIATATPQEWDFSALAKIIKGTAEAFSYVPGCKPQEPSITGAIKLTLVKQCCEEKKSFANGTKFSGSIGIRAVGIECLVPSLSVNFLGIVQLGVALGVSFGGEASGSGTQGPCTECGWSVDGKIGVTVSGKVIVITKIDPNFLRFEGGIKGDGTIQGSCDCKGCGNFKGCVGPVSVFGTAVLGGFLNKSAEFIIPHTKICT
jgi:hypothetical protein